MNSYKNDICYILIFLFRFELLYYIPRRVNVLLCLVHRLSHG